MLDPAITGQPSPVPSGSQWQADAAAGVRWSVSELQVQLDPQWQSMIAAGWQPVDLYASVEDVSGVLTVTRGSSTTQARFSHGGAARLGPLAPRLRDRRWSSGWKES